MTSCELTQEELKSLLFYNPETGEFTWLRSDKGIKQYKNLKAGCVKKDSGYVVIRIKGKLYKAHRLAWLYIYGQWPKHDIDHIDRDKTNNKIKNLRDVHRSINLRNKENIKGYTKQKNKYVSKISKDYKTIHLGIFSTPDEAKEAYEQAKSSID